MLDLFQSIFRRADNAAGHPPELVDAAIERAVAGTDSRLKALPGYRKKLRAPVLQAVDHVLRLVEELPSPVPATVASYRDHPLLGALFASPERMLDVIAHDRELARTLSGKTPAQPFYALLLARIGERTVLGIDEEGGHVRQDVQQTIVSFDDHRLLDVQADIEETRRALRRRAFDFILAQILATLESRRTSRERLDSQRKLLLRKREVLKSAGWGFDAPDETPKPQALEQQLRNIETELATLGTPAETLARHLEIVAEGLAQAETRLWLEPATLIMDHRHIVRSSTGSGAREIQFQRLCDSAGHRQATLLLVIDPTLLPKVDFFKEKARYLS